MIPKLLVCLILSTTSYSIALVLLPSRSFAKADSELFIGKAQKQGKLVYTEEHRAKFENGRVVEAETTYLSPDGKKIAFMKSDFRQNLTAPAHEFQDLRFGYRYGIRYDNKKPSMFSAQSDAGEKTKPVDSISSDKVLVGCQGLGYLFRTDLAKLKAQTTPILFLIPGRLDTYNFVLSHRERKDRFEIFEVEIKTWILRLFVPKITLTFDSENNRLLKYDGVSNLLDENKKEQLVSIQYEWPAVSQAK